MIKAKQLFDEKEKNVLISTLVRIASALEKNNELTEQLLIMEKKNHKLAKDKIFEDAQKNENNEKKES